MSQHTISTTHIQRLIGNALMLAAVVDGRKATHRYGLDGPQGYEESFDKVAVDVPLAVNARGKVLPEWALCKAIADLRHAADELDAERLNCYGWKQQ